MEGDVGRPVTVNVNVTFGRLSPSPIRNLDPVDDGGCAGEGA